MNQDKIKQQQRLFEELNSIAYQGPAQIEQFYCNYCPKLFKNFKTRANHWSSKNQCSHFHKIQRAEELLKILECIGCVEIFTKKGNCEKHMKNCDLVDKTQIQESQFLIEQRQLEQCIYQSMKIQKYDKDLNLSELKITKYIYEVKGGYICKKWQNYFKENLAQGRPIKLCVDVRNGDFWQNLNRTMLRFTGVLFTLVLQDNPWKDKKSMPYQYLPNHRLRQIPLTLVQEEIIIFYWTLHNTQKQGANYLKENGYQIKKTLVWIKLTPKQNLINSVNPEYSMEYCLIGVKGYFNQVQLNQILLIHKNHKNSEMSRVDQIFRGVIKLEIFTRLDPNKPNTVHVGNEFKGDREMKLKKLN